MGHTQSLETTYIIRSKNVYEGVGASTFPVDMRSIKAVAPFFASELDLSFQGHAVLSLPWRALLQWEQL